METNFMIVAASEFGGERALEFQSTPYLVVFRQDKDDSNSPFKLVCAAPNKQCAEDVLMSLNTQVRVDFLGGGPIFAILEAIKDLNSIMFNFDPSKQKDTTIDSGINSVEKQMLEEFEQEETKEKKPKKSKTDGPKFH